MSVENSIVLITSADPENTKFGTGFVIYVDGEGSYVLTCRHVVIDVGAVKGGSVRVNYHDYPVPKLFVNSGDDPDDMAVLKIDGLSGLLPLDIAPAVASGMAVRINGHYYFTAMDNHQKLPVDGVLGSKGALNFKSRKGKITTWNLEIQGSNRLKAGYSGSPVMDVATNTVVGVVSHELQKGEMGIAVCVSLLPEVWKDMPPGLLKPPIKKTEPSEGEEKSAQKPIPERKQFAPVDPKMCNRETEDTRFRDFLMSHCGECAPIPLFFIIPGEEGECHSGLVERFRDTRVKPLIESFGKPGVSKPVNKPWKVPWTITAEMSDAGRRYTLKEQLSKASLYASAPQDPARTLSDMFKSLNASQYKAVILSHNIEADEWDSELMHWYITRFWQEEFKCDEENNMPLFLIFLHIVYPESDYQSWSQRFLWKWHYKRRIARQLNVLKTKCDEHECRVLIFEELRGIRKKHVSQWFTKYGEGLMKKDKLDFIYGMFKKRSRVCMAEIEKELIRLVNENQKERFWSQKG